MENDQQTKINKLAEEILTNARNELLVDLRFLDVALNQLIWVPSTDITMCTNGQYLFYDPMFILRAYRDDQKVITRNYLHIVLHCVFRHMYNAGSMERTLWDLACDITAEATISELCIKKAEAGRQPYQQETIDLLKTSLGNLTAEKIYRYYRDNPPSDEDMDILTTCFTGDDHELWYTSEKNVNAMLAKAGKKLEEHKKGRGKGSTVPTGSMMLDQEKSQADKWKEISEKMQIELKTFARRHDTLPGGLMQNLEDVNRETVDYTEFLRKFAVRREFMKINDDEFDYIFYTYGLKLYKKIPLIEPLEYKEEKRIREFVIAIDTSGSVSGGLVQNFVQKTWNILKSTESFFQKINLHIIQCDSKIQEHVKITDQRSFDEYIKHMEIKGLGGTDFRPVFELVSKLEAEKEFTDLKGLIYFTDGNGQFPIKRPDYKVACVFLADAHNNFRVPPWVIQLVLTRDEIEEVPELW